MDTQISEYPLTVLNVIHFTTICLLNTLNFVELYLRPLLAKLTLPQAPSHHSAYPAVISQPHYPTTLTVSQLGYYFIAQTNNMHHNEQDKQLHLQKNV